MLAIWKDYMKVDLQDFCDDIVKTENAEIIQITVLDSETTIESPSITKTAATRVAIVYVPQ